MGNPPDNFGLILFASACIVLGFGGWALLEFNYPSNNDPLAHPTIESHSIPNADYYKQREKCVQGIVYYVAAGGQIAPKFINKHEVETCE